MDGLNFFQARRLVILQCVMQEMLRSRGLTMDSISTDAGRRYLHAHGAIVREITEVYITAIEDTEVPMTPEPMYRREESSE
jgi:hypothetical protein